MAVDGTWTLSMQTPLGDRSATLEVKADGGTLTGTQSAEGQQGPIYEGTVSGNNLAWKVDIKSPMPMTLEFEGAVDGDAISGSMSAGMYGSWSFSGKRG